MAQFFSRHPKVVGTVVNAEAFPTLVGTEKQIMWAADIRAKRAQYLADQFDLIFANAKDAGKVTADRRDEMLVLWSANWADELSRTSAKVWIENASIH